MAPSSPPPRSTDPAILALPRRIDEVDAQILTLVLTRAAVVSEVAVEKARLSLPVRDEQREQEHLAALLEMANAQGAPRAFSEVVRTVFIAIFDASRALQES